MKDTAPIFCLFHSIMVMSQKRWTPPHLHTWAGSTAWMQVRDLCQEETIYKCCRHNSMAQTGMTCTASLQAPQSVSTPPSHPAPTLSCIPPTWQVSTPLRAGRLTAKVQPFSVVHAFTWENHIPKIHITEN